MCGEGWGCGGGIEKVLGIGGGGGGRGGCGRDFVEGLGWGG